MSSAVNILLAVILILAWSVWAGGLAAVIGVTITSSKTLSPEERVRFFRKYGPTYFTTTTIALLVAYAVGWTLLARLPWTGEHTRMAIASVVLVTITLIGVAQAGRVRRLRGKLIAQPNDAETAKKLQGQTRLAAVLRGLIVVFTIGLTVHGAGVLVSVITTGAPGV